MRGATAATAPEACGSALARDVSRRFWQQEILAAMGRRGRTLEAIVRRTGYVHDLVRRKIGGLVVQGKAEPWDTSRGLVFRRVVERR